VRGFGFDRLPVGVIKTLVISQANQSPAHGVGLHVAVVVLAGQTNRLTT